MPQTHTSSHLHPYVQLRRVWAICFLNANSSPLLPRRVYVPCLNIHHWWYHTCHASATRLQRPYLSKIKDPGGNKWRNLYKGRDADIEMGDVSISLGIRTFLRLTLYESHLMLKFSRYSYRMLKRMIKRRENLFNIASTFVWYCYIPSA